MGNGNESLYARELSGGFPALRFQQPLEREFRAHYVRLNVVRLRATLLVGIVFMFSLAMLGWHFSPGDMRLQLLIVPLAAVSPALVIAVAATYPGFLARHIGALTGIAAASMSGGAFVMAWISLDDNPMAAIAVPVVTTGFVYLMMGLRLSTALCFAVPLLLGYLVLGFAFELSAQRFAYEVAALAFINLCGAHGCYRLEHASRTSFLEKEIVNILAGSDTLTGIPNRRMLNTHLYRVWRQAVRESRGLAVGIVEVDYFEAYGVRYGQQAADATLRRVAQTIMGCARRPLDFCARFSEREFALVLFDPNREYVEALGARVRDRIALLDIPHAASSTSGRLTVSIGLATSPPGVKYDPKDLLELADLALTAVKRRGGNAVVVKEMRADNGQVLKGPWQSSGA